uniref:Putative transporter n=1 Tax=Amblyomma aureolatum TaxID=187763 RepID=A0A1E1XDY9_9ACAR
MERNGLVATSCNGKARMLNETTPLKLDSQLLENGPFEGGDLNRKCVLTLSIVSVVFNIVVGGTGFVFAFQRNSASIYAFAAECLLDMLSSMIVIWQYLTPHYSFARERVACMLLGLFFILSAIAIISKAMDDLIVRESPTWIPVLIILAGVGAAACFLLAVVKLILAKRLGSLSLVIEGINSLISSFCAVAIIVSDLVYDSNPEVWYMDAVLSTVAALIMLLVGAKVLFENWSIGRHGHMTLQ